MSKSIVKEGYEEKFQKLIEEETKLKNELKQLKIIIARNQRSLDVLKLKNGANQKLINVGLDTIPKVIEYWEKYGRFNRIEKIGDSINKQIIAKLKKYQQNTSTTPYLSRKQLEELICKKQGIKIKITLIQDEISELVLSLSEMGFSTKVLNLLHKNSIFTIRELLYYLKEHETVRNIPRMGQTGENEVLTKLKQYI